MITSVLIDDNNEDTDYDLEIKYQTVNLESSHPLYLYPSDHPGQILVSTALNEENFNEWRRSMSLVLFVKNKLCFVSEKYKKPTETSKYHDHWQRCNDMIITWILNSIVPEIRSSLVYITLVSDVWKDLHIRFTQINGPRILN